MDWKVAAATLFLPWIGSENYQIPIERLLYGVIGEVPDEVKFIRNLLLYDRYTVTKIQDNKEIKGYPMYPWWVCGGNGKKYNQLVCEG